MAQIQERARAEVGAAMAREAAMRQEEVRGHGGRQRLTDLHKFCQCSILSEH